MGPQFVIDEKLAQEMMADLRTRAEDNQRKLAKARAALANPRTSQP